MRKVFYLSTCNTCSRIIKELQIDELDFEFQDIKTNPISSEDLDKLCQQVGSYEALFNKRARKYKSMNLKDKTISEDEWKSLILEEYTFLKRPVIIIDDEYFIGNSKKVVQTAKNKLDGIR